ncbi:MAG TPA: hypothetical protein VKM56_01785 [Verrucomicrobiae bacterium]|nr:hypothetical protein [Verrucomicrobiae bacterium]
MPIASIKPNLKAKHLAVLFWSTLRATLRWHLQPHAGQPKHHISPVNTVKDTRWQPMRSEPVRPTWLK